MNCGAIQETLFEREFFGHRKGAFSSAYADSPGYLDMADGGTLFLDEVGELTVNMQASSHPEMGDFQTLEKSESQQNIFPRQNRGFQVFFRPILNVFY